MTIKQNGEDYSITLEVGEEKGLPLWSALVNLEREIIGKTLEKFNGNKAKTADFLQLNRTTLVEKAKKYGFPSKKRPAPDYNGPTCA